MCGIAGIIAPALAPEDREARVACMVGRQAHRGPDDFGIVSADQATLGMRHLAASDSEQGHQPMVSPDERLQLVFNGTIYNRVALRHELTARGWEFRTHYDTEVLLAAFALFGPGCLKRLRGMFAFAVWDSITRTLFAARDPLGIKPLYFARLPDDSFVLASELNAILASGLVPREIDPIAVGDFLAWSSVPAPRTIYRGITNLPPGHAFSVSADGQLETFAWWHLPSPQPASSVSRHEVIAGLRAQLEDTIRAHLPADGPIGAFFSGGLNSTAIVGLMAASGMRPVKTFSLIFNETAYSEQSVAQLATRALGMEHHERLLTGTDLARDLPCIVSAFDQPTGAGIVTYYASLVAREGGVKVALSGLGGDELFGDCPSFRDMPRLARWLPVWRALPQRVRAVLLARLRRGDAREQKLADFLEHARDLHELCALRQRALAEPARLKLLALETRRLTERQGPAYPRPAHPRLDEFIDELVGADPHQIVSAWELRTQLADVALRDSDVWCRAHDLELRTPFLDCPLLEWWWRQPTAVRSQLVPAKAPLADAVADLIPTRIRAPRQPSFTLPLAVWMRRELRPFLEETFSSTSLARCPWLDAREVQQYWHAFASGRDSHAWSHLWALAMFVAFVNRPAPAR